MKAKTLLFLRVLAGVLALALPVLSAPAATWVLANGDRLTGELVRETPDYLEVQHPQLGRLKLPRTALAAPLATVGAAGPPVAKALPVAAPPEADSWKRQLEVGYSQQSGAKDKQDLSVRLQVDGREGANTFRSTARLLQSDTAGVTVTARREADFRWRYDINKRLFAQSLTTYAADEVRKIDLSLEQQLGGGYKLIDTARHKANVGLGAVVQYLERVSAEAQTALLASFFQDYAYQLNNRLKLMQESSFMISDTGTLSVKDGLGKTSTEGSYRLKFISGLQSKVTDRMSLNVRFEYDYDRSILDAALRADQRLTTSLGYIW